MAEMLLINPRRRKARRTHRTAAQRRATAKLVAMSRRRRRHNPATVVAAQPRRRRHAARRHNPMHAYRAHRRTYRRRHHNPAMRFSAAGIMGALKGAVVQGGGAILFDLAHGQIQKFLPASLVPTPGNVGLGDVVKAAITVGLGAALNRSTGGFSSKAAMGALTIQVHDLIKGMLPSTLPLGYATPGMVVQGSSRVGPNRAIVGVGRYVAPGQTPLLSAYTQPGATPLLNGARSAMYREGVSTYR